MRKLAFGTIVVMSLIALVIAGPASAQDNTGSASTMKTVSSVSSTDSADLAASAPTPAPAPKKGSSSNSNGYNWSGFSLGASLGYTLGNGDTFFNPLPDAATFIDLNPQTLLLHPHGVIGGLQAGYDHQHRMWVFGLAADFSGTGINGTTSVSPITNSLGVPFSPAGGSFLAAKEEVKYLSTIRGRIGVVADQRLLFYATGGVAMGRFILGADSNFEPFGSEDYLADLSRIKVGWTAGGGILYGARHHWNMGFEYLYYDFPNESHITNPNPANPPFQVGYNWAAKGQIIRAVFNYKF